jgi:hypothetical protein
MHLGELQIKLSILIFDAKWRWMVRSEIRQLYLPRIFYRSHWVGGWLNQNMVAKRSKGDYRRDLDLWPGLLKVYTLTTHEYTLQITDTQSHWITTPNITHSLTFTAALLQLTLFFACSRTELKYQLKSKSKSHCYWRSVSQSVSRINNYRLTVTLLFLWGALSDEKTGLSFVYAAGPCQGSLSRVWVFVSCL